MVMFQIRYCPPNHRAMRHISIMETLKSHSHPLWIHAVEAARRPQNSFFFFPFSRCNIKVCPNHYISYSIEINKSTWKRSDTRILTNTHTNRLQIIQNKEHSGSIDIGIVCLTNVSFLPTDGTFAYWLEKKFFNRVQF